jgi:hypothetical protein
MAEQLVSGLTGKDTDPISIAPKARRWNQIMSGSSVRQAD